MRRTMSSELKRDARDASNSYASADDASDGDALNDLSRAWSANLSDDVPDVEASVHTSVRMASTPQWH